MRRAECTVDARRESVRSAQRGRAKLLLAPRGATAIALRRGASCVPRAGSFAPGGPPRGSRRRPPAPRSAAAGGLLLLGPASGDQILQYGFEARGPVWKAGSTDAAVKVL